MSADYAIPMSWEDLLADEKQRRLAADFLASGGVTGGAEDRAPYAWETDGTRRPGQDAQTAPNFPGVDLAHQSMPTTPQDRFQSLAHALKGIPADTLASFAAGTDANMRRILGEPVAQVAPASRTVGKTHTAATNKPQKSTDPNSPESKRAQGQVKDLLGDNISDEVLVTMTEADAENILKYGTAKAQRGLQARGQEITETGQKNTNARAIDRTKQDDVHFWAKMQQDAEQFNVSDATRRYIAEQALKAAEAARDEAAATKEKDKQEARNVPDFEITPGSTPTPADAEKVKATNESAKRMRGMIGNLRGLMRQYGDAPEPKSTGASLQQQALTAVQLEAKNVAALGALSGDDFKLMKDLSDQDLTEIGAWIRRNFAGRSLSESLHGLEQWMNTIVNSTAAARGYRPKAPKPERTTPDKVLPKDAAGNPTLDAPPPKTGKVRVREKATGRMKDLSPDAAAKVLADPAYEKVTP